jgi:glycosyltransferase involved in cell wall biosynthesis
MVPTSEEDKSSMSEPLVSVVMVVCNVDRFLAESIDSILGQTFRDFEFVIVDYGSVDSTKDIVRRYAANDARVRLHEIPHCGLGESRNAACSLARGQYLAMMDADDVALPERIQLEVDFMARHPNVGLLGGAVQWINVMGQPLYVGHVPTDDKQLRRSLDLHCPFWQPTVLVRKEAFTQSGGYRDAFAPAEDYDLWLRVTEYVECANLEQVVLKYRMHPQQVSLRRKKQQTLGILAAQRSAAMRRAEQPDPFNSVEVITSKVLADLGVDESSQERKFVSESQAWIRHMVLAGEIAVALDTAVELLRTNSMHTENWQLADLYLTIADLRWRRGEFVESLRSVARAVRARPKVLGRPLRPLLERLRFTAFTKSGKVEELKINAHGH